ncbi:MAG: hypothetical protein Kow0069_35730 [Promethearchaeota archaeon]
MDKAPEQVEGLAGGTTGVPTFVLLALGTNFFVQATREFLIGRNVFEQLLPLALALLVSVLVAPLLAWVLQPAPALALLGAALGAGRVLLLVPDADPSFPAYFAAMFLACGAGPAFLSFGLSLPVKDRGVPPGLVAAGVAAGAAHNVAFRVAGLTNDFLAMWFLAFVAWLAAAALSWESRDRWLRTADQRVCGSLEPGTGRGASAVLGWAPALAFWFLPAGDPELVAHLGATSLQAAALVLSLGTLAGGVVALALGGRPLRLAGAAGAIAATLVVGTAYYVPPSAFSLPAWFVGAAGVGLAAGSTLSQLVDANFKRHDLLAAITTLLGVLLMMVVRLTQLAVHAPWLFVLAGGGLVAATVPAAATGGALGGRPEGGGEGP